MRRAALLTPLEATCSDLPAASSSQQRGIGTCNLCYIDAAGGPNRSIEAYALAVLGQDVASFSDAMCVEHLVTRAADVFSNQMEI